VSKQGELVKYESKPNTHIDLPAVVLIDNRTDNGGLLVAAVLQDQKRATIIGEQKNNVNGAVSSLVFPPGVNRALVLATGEILLPNKQPLASGVRVDVNMPANDDDALLGAARTALGQH
jgi:C-terminal processing protease CtpA/Prc